MKKYILLIMLLSTSAFCYAGENDYIISIYGGGEVIAVEHNGIIHAFGIGSTERESNGTSYETSSSDEYTSDSDSDINWFRNKAEEFKSEAENNNESSHYYYAALYFKKAGDMEQATEMANKEIELLLNEDPVDYEGIAQTYEKILENQELSNEYMKKHYENKLSKLNEQKE